MYGSSFLAATPGRQDPCHLGAGPSHFVTPRGLSAERAAMAPVRAGHAARHAWERRHSPWRTAHGAAGLGGGVRFPHTLSAKYGSMRLNARSARKKPPTATTALYTNQPGAGAGPPTTATPIPSRMGATGFTSSNGAHSPNIETS